ncbi:MAG: sialidase family protein [Eubacteriales bacterium]
MKNHKIKITKKTVFKKSLFKKSNYAKYRIPGIIVTKNDTLLAYYEARKTTSDWAKIDIVLMRSTDAGKTFSPEVCLVNGVEKDQTVNNPVMIVGNDNTIHFLYCVEYAVSERGGGVFYQKSVDDGLTFSAPTDISNSILPAECNVFGLGPGHGICTKDGVLIVAVWFVKKSFNQSPSSHHPGTVATLFSLDNGSSWQVGEELPHCFKDANESALAELDTGEIMLNARVKGEGYRGVATSKTGYSGWSELKLDKSLIDPTCFGSIASVFDANGKSEILFINCESKRRRNNLTIKTSFVNGKSWSKLVTIRKGHAGYADIASDSKGNIFAAYEVNGGYGEAVAKIRRV